MANTYAQIYLHVVFSVKGRQNLIQKSWKDELHKYICGIVKGKFQWQEGFGAFSYAQSQLDTVIAYINNQEQHHLNRIQSFQLTIFQHQQNIELIE